MPCEGNRDWRTEPFEQRREKLESLLAIAMPPVHLTPATRELNVASDWFRRFEGAGLDGVMARPISGTYQPGEAQKVAPEIGIRDIASELPVNHSKVAFSATMYFQMTPLGRAIR